MDRARLLATASLVAIGSFGAGIAALHALLPALDSMQHVLSEYGVSAYAGVFTASLVVVAAGIWAFAGAASLALPPGAARRVAAALAVIAGAGIFVAGVFPMETPGSGEATFHGTAHAVGARVGFVTGALAVFAVAAAMGRDPSWRVLRWPTILLGVVAFGLIAALQIAPRSMEGLLQRMLVAAILGGVVVACLRIRMLRPAA